MASTQSLDDIYTKLENIDPIISGTSYSKIKRVFDILLSLISIPVWVPLMFACVIAIKLESPKGPAIFYQSRTGKNGKRFNLYKFRTMVENAEELKKELMHLNELEWPDFKITNDPRITKVGKFLRKTSLDEFPQIFNIIKGDMSIVGPRPTSFRSETYSLWQTERLDIKPGLTGVWQIYGRGEIEFVERVRLDILYVQLFSLGLDIFLIYQTIFAVLKQKGK